MGLTDSFIHSLIICFPDNLQPPRRRLYEIRQPPTRCVQLPASSYNFQLPHGSHDHHGRHGYGGYSACGEHGGQYRTGQN